MDIGIILSLMQEETQEKEVRLLKVSMAEPWLECRLVQSQKHPASRQSALFYLVYTPSCSPSDKCPKNGAVSPEGSECAMAKSSRPQKTGGSGVPPRQSWKASVSEEESAHADRGLFFHLELILRMCPLCHAASASCCWAQGASFLLRISPLPGVCRWLVLISWSHLVDEANINAWRSPIPGAHFYGAQRSPSTESQGRLWVMGRGRRLKVRLLANLLPAAAGWQWWSHLTYLWAAIYIHCTFAVLPFSAERLPVGPGGIPLRRWNCGKRKWGSHSSSNPLGLCHPSLKLGFLVCKWRQS